MAQLSILIVPLLPLLVRPACGLVKKDALDSELLQPDASFARESDSNGLSSGSYINCGFGMADIRQWAQSKTVRQDWPCSRHIIKTALSMNKKTILCVGDSLTSGHQVTGQENYPARLHDMLDNEFNVINLGVPKSLASLGLSSRELRKRSYAGYPQAHVALNYTDLDVAAIIVQLGTNDLEVWNATSFHEDYYKFALGLMTVHPKAAFVFAIPPIREVENVDVDKGLAHEIKSVQAELHRALGHTQSATVNMQDYFAAYQTERKKLFTDGIHHPKSLFKDGIHPTRPGYMIYGKAMSRAVRRIFGLPPGKQASDDEFEGVWLLQAEAHA